MKIGIDLDDVLGQFIPALIEFHNNKYGTDIKFEKFNSYKFWEVWGGNMEEAIQKVYDFHKTPYFKNIKTIDGAEEVLNRLKENNELYIVTSRQEDVIKETEEWVDKNFPKIFKKIYFTNQYSRSGIETTKQKVCDDLDMDILIEDNLKYAEECSRPDRKIFLFDKPWNQSEKLPPNVKRIYSWKEIDI